MQERTRSRAEQVKALLAQASALERFWPAYRARTADPQVDKHAALFELDEHTVLTFTVGKAQITFGAYTGRYGSSGVSSMNLGARFNAAQMGRHLLAYLNANAEHVFQRIANRIREEAQQLVTEARAEVDEMDLVVRTLEGREPPAAAEPPPGDPPAGPPAGPPPGDPPAEPPAGPKRPDLDTAGRETNFTDTLTIYEIVNRDDGTGRGMFLTAHAADAERDPGTELIASATYTLAKAPEYVD
ncbi:MAG: hypothetical protein OXG35_13050 [Acidobacteria bacterium]|nr:hypothetical protein [Acidobacteriota bacterium]